MIVNRSASSARPSLTRACESRPATVERIPVSPIFFTRSYPRRNSFLHASFNASLVGPATTTPWQKASRGSRSLKCKGLLQWRALKRCEQLLQEAQGHKFVEGAVLAQQGRLHAMEGRFQAARRYASDARGIYESLGLAVQEAAHAQDVWEIETLAGRPSAAESELRLGMARLEEMGEQSLLSTMEAVLAHVLVAQERYAEAMELTSLSERTADAHDVASQVLCRITKASALSHTQAVDEGKYLAHEAVRLADGSDWSKMRADARMQLAEILCLQNDLDRVKQSSLPQRTSMSKRASPFLQVKLAANLSG